MQVKQSCTRDITTVLLNHVLGLTQSAINFKLIHAAHSIKKGKKYLYFYDNACLNKKLGLAVVNRFHVSTAYRVTTTGRGFTGDEMYRTPVVAAAAASINFRGYSFSRSRNICDTLGFCRAATAGRGRFDTKSRN